MKKIAQKILLVGMITLLGLTSCTKRYKPQLSSQEGINFKIISLAQAKAAAKAENKPLFVFAHASWCPTCKKMEQEVLTQKELGNAYNQGFVNVAIDIDSPEGAELKKSYPITATPTLFFFKPDGSIEKKVEGFTTADELLADAQTQTKS